MRVTMVSLRGLNLFFRTIKIYFSPQDLNGHFKKNQDALQLLTFVFLRRDLDQEKELPAVAVECILCLVDVKEALGWMRNRQEIRGLNIGCWASCFYLLLGFTRNRTK